MLRHGTPSDAWRSSEEASLKLRRPMSAPRPFSLIHREVTGSLLLYAGSAATLHRRTQDPKAVLRVSLYRRWPNNSHLNWLTFGSWLSCPRGVLADTAQEN